MYTYKQIMFNNILTFLDGKEFNDSLKNELYLKYIKMRELKTDDNTYDNLYLLFNRKTETDIQKECSGLILEKNTNNIIAACQHDFEETPKDKNDFVSAEYCEDGTIIRLYNYNNMWVTATKKCIDAKFSFWSNTKTFNDMFWEVFSHNNMDLSALDKNCTYIFVLLHLENLMVVKHTQNELVYLGNVNNVTHVTNDATDLGLFSVNPYIKLPEKVNLTKDELDDFNAINTRYFNPTKRGIIIKYNNNKIYKFDFNEFTFMQKIRGNEPLIRNRYLELLSDPESLNILVSYYQEHAFTFSMVHHNLIVICNEIYKLYRETHVKHAYKIEEDHLYYKTIKQLHGQYKKTNKPITKDDVFSKLQTYNSFILKKLLKWVN